MAQLGFEVVGEEGGDDGVGGVGGTFTELGLSRRIFDKK